MIRPLVALVGVSAASLVWAEIGELPMPNLSNMTSTGILGWYAWHTASRTIPGLLADFRAELAVKCAESRADREAFQQELNAERAQRHGDNLAILQALHRLNEAVGAPRG